MGQLPDNDDHLASATPNLRDSIASDDDDNTETPRMAHDSMVTVRLSEPPVLRLDTNVGPGAHESRNLIGGELIPIEESRIGGELIPLSSTPFTASILAPPLPPAAALPSQDVPAETAASPDRSPVEDDDEWPRPGTRIDTMDEDAMIDDTRTEVADEDTSRNLEDELQDYDEQEDETSAEATPISESGESNWDQPRTPEADVELDEDQDVCFIYTPEQHCIVLRANNPNSIRLRFWPNSSKRTTS
jgi:hypothetical protein